MLFNTNNRFLLRKGIRIIPFPWHMRMAVVMVVFALTYATLVIWQFFS